MTLDEAKQLNPCDKVLVEVEVTNPIDNLGYLRVLFNGIVEFVSHKTIHSKIAIPRREFRKGDVVMTHSGKVRYVTEIDDDDIVLSEYEDGLNPEGCEEAELTLICAAEDRADRKGEP